MTRYLFILPALSSMFWFCSFLALAIYFIGCKSPAPVEPVTEQPREPRPAPAAPHSAYVPYTNSQQDRLIEDYRIPLASVHTNTLTNINYSTNIYVVVSNAANRLVERHELIGPPVVPGRGPFPLIVPKPSTSNWMTKAMGVQPNPMVTNQVPGSVILTRITTTGSDGKPFTAELELHGNQTIHANDKVAVILFAIQTTNYLVEVCTNLTDGKWMPFSRGVSQDTNGAIVVVDVHEGTRPVGFYKQVEAK